MNRTASLEALVKVTMPISEAISRLTEFPWDSDTELVNITPEDFCHVLSLFKQNSLSSAEIEDWANALECRDDVGLSALLTQELLYELANPLLTQPLSSERADSGSLGCKMVANRAVKFASFGRWDAPVAAPLSATLEL